MFNPEKSDGKPFALVLSNSNVKPLEGKLAQETLIFKDKGEIDEAVKSGKISEEEGKDLADLNDCSKNPVIAIFSKKAGGACTEQLLKG